MKIENQVCTQQQAKRIKELGIIQKSLFYYHPNFERPVFGEIWTTKTGKQYEKTQVCNDKKGSFSAFTVSELGIMLDSETYTQRTGSENSQFANWEWVNDGSQTASGPYVTEAEARADMLITSLTNGTLLAKTCNIRLAK